mgnify:FL=1|jgi:hypothetical protein
MRIKRTYPKTKMCQITGLQMSGADFYRSSSSTDGLHPYSKPADNFRRRLLGKGVGTMHLKNMFNKLNLR